LFAHLLSNLFTGGLNRAQTGNRKRPRCIIIAGPNGAGKTTFARHFLPEYAGVIHFVNADLLAAGLSPLHPQLAAVASGRLLLAELDRLAEAKADFAFESTLSGLTYLGRIKKWRAAGYRVEIIFLKLDSVQLALRRISARVRQGGHPVPATDVSRRFARGWHNFLTIYKLQADAWMVYDNSDGGPRVMEHSDET
jgi:predicted ABC-type ATPase